MRKIYLDGDLFPVAKKENTGFIRTHFFYDTVHNELLNAVMLHGQRDVETDGRVFYLIPEEHLPCRPSSARTS
jgi:hypothetical protein